MLQFALMDEAHKLKTENMALKGIALFEGFKGMVVILAGFGCLAMLNRDLESVGDHIVLFLHLDPTHHYPELFLSALSNLENKDLLWLSAGALLYSVLKFIEGYGLWYARVWAEWLAIISGGLYIPLEVYELYKEVTWIRVTLTTVNVALVGYLLWLRETKAAERKKRLHK